MNLIVGVQFLANDPNKHRQIIKVKTQLMWENFLSELMVAYQSKKNERTDIDVYVSDFYANNKKYYLFEYIIPMVLVDYYDRKEFKSVLPRGSMIDLISSDESLEIDWEVRFHE